MLPQVCEKKRPLVACLHPYLEGRREEIERGLYPSQHLWGLAGIEQAEHWRTETISTAETRLPSLLEKLLDRSLFRGSPGAKVELAVLRAARRADLVYSVCGPLVLVRRFRRAGLVSWVFREPPIHGTGPRLAHAAYRPGNLGAHTGFLALTPTAEKAFAEHAPSRFLPWCVDLALFDGKPAAKPFERPFFLATGKTERDYATLAQAACKVDADVRVIGPASVRPNDLPHNLFWTDTSADKPDQAIDYPTLRNWYAQATAVCIPLTGDADDTCGYTNLLEAMAMAKPALMTRSGCLHLDPETQGFGYLVSPSSPKDWIVKMNELILNPERAFSLGAAGRALAERDFYPQRFDRDVVAFLRERLIEK